MVWMSRGEKTHTTLDGYVITWALEGGRCVFTSGVPIIDYNRPLVENFKRHDNRLLQENETFIGDK